MFMCIKLICQYLKILIKAAVAYAMLLTKHCYLHQSGLYFQFGLELIGTRRRRILTKIGRRLESWYAFSY